MGDTIPQFFCLRYKGLKRPDEMLADHTRMGWSFRKWQNWKQVHVGKDDKQLLKLCGDQLVDHEKLDLKDFGRISQILLNVQRWRKDRENLAIEPDLLASWAECDRLLTVANENPNVIAQQLQRDLKDAKSIPQESLVDVFYWHNLSQFFSKLKHPGLTQSVLSPPWNLESTGAEVCSEISKLYASVGLILPKNATQCSARNLTLKCLRDLGFPEPDYKAVINPVQHIPDIQDKLPIVKYESFGSLSLLKIANVEGHLYIVINRDHAFVKNIAEISSKDALELLLAAYAEAATELLRKDDDCEQLSLRFGLALKRIRIAKR